MVASTYPQHKTSCHYSSGVTSEWMPLSVLGRAKNCRTITSISISAMFSQLPYLGVELFCTPMNLNLYPRGPGYYVYVFVAAAA